MGQTHIIGAGRAGTVWDFGKGKRLISMFLKMYLTVHQDYVYCGVHTIPR
jgi:hypothetical protein